MSNTRPKPSSDRPDVRRPPSSRPRAVAQLDDALSDAAKVARRIEQLLDEDAFAAALLAREYLSIVQHRDVNPLNQRGSTDAWTSAFVRLRVAGRLLDRDERRADGEAYLAARAEERRLLALYGKAPRSLLTTVRAQARASRRRMRVLRLVAWLSCGAAVVLLPLAFVLGLRWVAILAAPAGALAAACFAAARVALRASRAATERSTELERGLSGLAAFEASDRGRGLLNRIQSEHPALLRTSFGVSSAPPPPKSGRVPRSR